MAPLVLAQVLAHHGDDDHMDMDGWDWLWGSLMMVTIVAVIGLVVWGIIRATQHTGGHGHPHHRAREILAERLARGEISAEEYQDLSRHL
jgi:putative membrane protein